MKNKYYKKIIKFKCEKKYSKAIELADKSFKMFQDNCFKNEIVNCLILQNKRKEAIAILEDMIDIEPENLALYKKLAFEYYITLDYKKALKEYKYVLKKDPTSCANYYNVGLMYHISKNYQKACFYYKNSLKLCTFE